MPQVVAFRLRRHHFTGRRKPGLTAVSQDVCGIQAQVMSAAEIALWARNHALTRDDIHTALWKERTLVKTSLMRGTLHLIPTTEFPVYIAALRNSRLQSMRQIMARYGVKPEEADAVTAAVVDRLRDGPMTRSELTDQVVSLPILGKKAKPWFQQGWWGVVRQAIVEGTVCYGPDRGQETTLTRVEQWLPRQRKVHEREAARALLRRYLGAYGPATLRDYAKWTGMSVKDARMTWEDLKPELVEVMVDGDRGSLLRDDYKTLSGSRLGGRCLRLLPYFDPFMLGHADKNHLLEKRHYKSVYRKAGWISPVILLNGKVIGTWSYTRKSSALLIEVKPFQRLSKTVRAEVDGEAASLGGFLGAAVQIRYP